MSSDQLLDGEAGSEAQANEILRLTNEMMKAAIEEIQLAAGNDATAIGGGYPVISIGRAASS